MRPRSRGRQFNFLSVLDQLCVMVSVTASQAAWLADTRPSGKDTLFGAARWRFRSRTGPPGPAQAFTACIVFRQRPSPTHDHSDPNSSDSARTNLSESNSSDLAGAILRQGPKTGSTHTHIYIFLTVAPNSDASACGRGVFVDPVFGRCRSIVLTKSELVNSKWLVFGRVGAVRIRMVVGSTDWRAEATSYVGNMRARV